MQTITSGTSLERVIRTLLLMALIAGFAIAYLWDGYVGYARRNAEELATLLGETPASLPLANPLLTAAEGRRMSQAAIPGDGPSAITSILGQPTLRHGDDAYFLGRGGWLKVQLTGDRIVGVAWTDGPKTESDQRWQRWIGYVLAVGGLIVAVRVALVLATQLTLSDEGLQIRGQRLIPWDAITALRADPSGRAGCIEIEYSLAGRSQRLRLDVYVYRRLPEIVVAICERKGFLNPWPAPGAVGST